MMFRTILPVRVMLQLPHIECCQYTSIKIFVERCRDDSSRNKALIVHDGSDRTFNDYIRNPFLIITEHYAEEGCHDENTYRWG